MTAPEPTQHAPTWEVVTISRAAWRICDASLTATNASRLVAYVEKNDAGIYEVLWLRSPCPNRFRYRALNEVFTDLNAAAETDHRGRATPPTRIPHFPPGSAVGTGEI